MNKPDNIFLTDNRRDVLIGNSDWSQPAVSNERSRIKNRASLALDELIDVAGSPEIDNADVFDVQQVYTLISILTNGTGGLVYETEEARQKALESTDDNRTISWDPDPDYANELESRLAKLLIESQYDD